MELVQKYWYLVVAALVLLFFMARRSSGGTTVQQIGGADSNTLALASLASSEREADENRKYGLISTILGYQLSNKSLDQQIDLANISATAQTKSLENQYLLASLQAQLQQGQYNQQFTLQNTALQNAYNNQRRNDWLGAISTGVQTILPQLFGNQTTGGGLGYPTGGTPPIFGQSINWRDWF